MIYVLLNNKDNYSMARRDDTNEQYWKEKIKNELKKRI